MVHAYGYPVLCEASLDASGERLHDVVIDGGHEAKIEEDDAAVLSKHQVALVGVSVHVPEEVSK